MVDDAQLLPGARNPLSIRHSLRGITHMIAVPQGFTLSIAGTLTITIGERGFPGAFAVWLFIAGAGAGFAAVTLLSGAHREPANRPLSVIGLSLLNLSALLVVPLAAAAAWWIPDDAIAMAAAGAAAAVLYVWLTAATMAAVLCGRPRQGRVGQLGTSTADRAGPR